MEHPGPKVNITLKRPSPLEPPTPPPEFFRHIAEANALSAQAALASIQESQTRQASTWSTARATVPERAIVEGTIDMVFYSLLRQTIARTYDDPTLRARLMGVVARQAKIANPAAVGFETQNRVMELLSAAEEMMEQACIRAGLPAGQSMVERGEEIEKMFHKV